MHTPAYHDGYPQNEASAKAEAQRRVREITSWFIHVNDVTPRLRVQRIAAINYLRSAGVSIPEISRMTGMNEYRINEILKEERAKEPPPSVV